MKTLLLILLFSSSVVLADKLDDFKKPSEEKLKKSLTSEQFNVTQHEGTERPFHNEYWDNHKDGIYVDIVSGEVLFSSKDKYDSGTGWPSFTKPLEKNNIITKTDNSLLGTRTEVRSKHADSHLGHVFDDGPQPLGLRYCMNSASMRFIPVDKLKAEGLEKYESLFKKDKKDTMASAIFAGGCFWSMESAFEKVGGVMDVVSGYTGGKKDNPTYEEVSSGNTGHLEAVQVTYDPKKVSYEELLKNFWKASEPYNANGQFVDSGPEYRSVIFYGDDKEKKMAEKSMDELVKSKRFDKKIVTQIMPAAKFWKAEDYHQDYYKKNSAHYMMYRSHSGREEYLKKYWGKDAH